MFEADCFPARAGLLAKFISKDPILTNIPYKDGLLGAKQNLSSLCFINSDRGLGDETCQCPPQVALTESITERGFVVINISSIGQWEQTCYICKKGLPFGQQINNNQMLICSETHRFMNLVLPDTIFIYAYIFAHMRKNVYFCKIKFTR